MFGKIVPIALALGMLAAPAWAHDAGDAMAAPPAEPFVKVSDALPLPEFIPGLGTLYVDPATLPVGPFLAYDHDGKLSATIYMAPISALEEGGSFNDLALGLDTVTSTDIYYNAGHPGVEEPHVHVVLYHDDGAKARLAE